MTTNNNKTTNVNESKWGFHPCSYEIFKQLKAIKKYYWKSVYAYYGLQRQLAKDEHNRVPEWKKLEEAFNKRYGMFKFEYDCGYKKDEEGKYIFGKDSGYVWYTRYFSKDGEEFLKLFEEARMPSEEPVAQWSNDTLEDIENLYAFIQEVQDDEC